MSKIEVDTIEPQSGTTITLGASGDTVAIASGVALSGFTSTGIDDNATSTAVTIDSSQNVGIGTTSPDTKFHVQVGDASASSHPYARFTLESDQSYNIFQLLSPSTGYQQIRFGDPSDNGAGYIQYNHNVNNMTFGVSSERLTIASNGEVSVNDTAADTGAPVFKVKGAQNNDVAIFTHKNTGGTSEVLIRFRDGDQTTCGTIGINPSGNTVSYNTSSDYRLKENVNYDFDATTRLKQLKPARFNFISDANDTIVDGFLAHEVSSIVPEAVQGEKDEMERYREGDNIPEGSNVGDFKLDDDGNQIPKYQGIDQSKLVPLLVKTIQELEARITALENN